MTKRVIKAPTGNKITCKNWTSEAAMRMLMNNLDPEVAECPEDLIVYGGGGKAARNWECYDKIIESLKNLEDNETLLVQSGKPVAVFKTHTNAPRVIISNAQLVPAWATWDEFRRLDALGLTMYGQMTAGSWIYIGSQGIVQGTYETYAEVARQHFTGSLIGAAGSKICGRSAVACGKGRTSTSATSPSTSSATRASSCCCGWSRRPMSSSRISRPVSSSSSGSTTTR